MNDSSALPTRVSFQGVKSLWGDLTSWILTLLPTHLNVKNIELLVTVLWLICSSIKGVSSVCIKGKCLRTESCRTNTQCRKKYSKSYSCVRRTCRKVNLKFPKMNHSTFQKISSFIGYTNQNSKIWHSTPKVLIVYIHW